ncbi:MAG: AAA family ATPase, partial [Pseudomonadota bacterium]
MQIKGLRLKEVGKFAASHSIDGLAPGLNVLIGSNEHGKSTILRALRILFEFPHTSNHATVRGLRPYSGGAPRIACEFSLAGDDWYLSKQYLSSRNAELRTSDGSRLYRGGDVDAALSELVEKAAGSLATLKSQWVAQGEGFQPPRAAAETVVTIQNAIVEEVSTATGGDQLDAIVQSVSSQLSGLVTPKGRKPRAGGPLHEAQRELAAISATLDDLQLKERASAERLARFTEISAVVAGDQGDEALPRLREQILAQREAIEAAQKRLAQCELATERRRRQAAELASVEAGLAAFMGSIKAFDERRLRLSELGKLVSDLLAAKSVQQQQVSGLVGQLTELQEKQEQFKRSKLIREQRYRLSELTERVNETANRVSAAQEMQVKIAAIDERLKACNLDQATHERAVLLKQETEKLDIELKAQSARLEVTYLTDRRATFSLDDEELEDGDAIAIDHPVTINAPGIGQLRIAPGRSEETAELRQRHLDGHNSLVDLLRDSGFETVLELETTWRENGQLQAERVHLAGGLKQIAPDGIDHLLSLRTQLDQQAQDIRSGLPDSEIPQDGQSEDVADQVAMKAQELEAVQYDIARQDERERQLKSEQQLLAQQLEEITETEILDAGARETKVTDLKVAVREATDSLNLAVRQEHALLEGAPSRQQIADETQTLQELEKTL